MESLINERDKSVLKKRSIPLELFSQFTSVVVIWYFITSYDVRLSHNEYKIVIVQISMSYHEI